MSSSCSVGGESEPQVKTVTRPQGVTCLCGDSECTHLTGAFTVLNDARRRFVLLPTEKQRRESHLRHLFPNSKKHSPLFNSQENHYIALHHFHPSLISKDGTLPKNISLGQACQLRMKLDQRDKVIDNNGMPAFLTVPNYPLERVEMDLQKHQKSNTILLVQEFPIPQHVNVLSDNDNNEEDSVASSVGSGDWRDTSLSELSKRDYDTLVMLQSAAITCQVRFLCEGENKKV